MKNNPSTLMLHARPPRKCRRVKTFVSSPLNLIVISTLRTNNALNSNHFMLLVLANDVKNVQSSSWYKIFKASNHVFLSANNLH